MTTFLIVIIALALIFDYINGFHDAANSIATVVSTKVLTPFQAVIWAAIFNFVAFFIFKDHGVANTIAKTVKTDDIPGHEMMVIIFSGLIAAIFWNLLDLVVWHSFFFFAYINWWICRCSGGQCRIWQPSIPQSVLKTASFILLAPLVGMIMAFIISLWFIHSFRKG